MAGAAACYCRAATWPSSVEHGAMRARHLKGRNPGAEGARASPVVAGARLASSEQPCDSCVRSARGSVESIGHIRGIKCHGTVMVDDWVDPDARPSAHPLKHPLPRVGVSCDWAWGNSGRPAIRPDARPGSVR